ncbi:C-reactive protein-like [Chiloscyllium punctatum]|uniref:C-reactive protein-like n=1 Tax=Chiloscyllium punctatum TaxID=137246 RepID=UPI003B63E8D4
MAAVITVALLTMTVPAAMSNEYLPPALEAAGLWQFSAVFPNRSDVNHVTLLPLRDLPLDALTLCMRLASEDLDRDVILFSYAGQGSPNELHVWLEVGGRYYFYIRDHVAYFKLPPLDAILRHLRFTWESDTGATTVWMDGQPSRKKVMARGQAVRIPVVIMIGQGQDAVGGSFEAEQSFVGVHLKWGLSRSTCHTVMHPPASSSAVAPLLRDGKACVLL